MFHKFWKRNVQLDAERKFFRSRRRDNNEWARILHTVNCCDQCQIWRNHNGSNDGRVDTTIVEWSCGTCRNLQQALYEVNEWFIVGCHANLEIIQRGAGEPRRSQRYILWAQEGGTRLGNHNWEGYEGTRRRPHFNWKSSKNKQEGGHGEIQGRGCFIDI